MNGIIDGEVNLWYNFYVETTIRVMGQKIRQLRTDSRLTLEEAAERAGCTPGFLSQVERNQAVPSISMLYAIAQALGVKVTYFFPRMISGTKVVRADEREVFRFEGSSTVGDETFVLKAGDSIHYQAFQPHSWRNEGDEECIALWAVSPPILEAELEG
jgi:transcriptional regulator with XRE-family HTH domain